MLLLRRLSDSRNMKTVLTFEDVRLQPRATAVDFLAGPIRRIAPHARLVASCVRLLLLFFGPILLVYGQFLLGDERILFRRAGAIIDLLTNSRNLLVERTPQSCQFIMLAVVYGCIIPRFRRTHWHSLIPVEHLHGQLICKV